MKLPQGKRTGRVKKRADDAGGEHGDGWRRPQSGPPAPAGRRAAEERDRDVGG